MKKISGTKEWAATNENVIKGCSHGCLYCYACSNAARSKTKDPANWTTEEVNEKARAKIFGKRKGTIMFPTTHDLTPENMDVTIPFLKRMLEAGNNVLVVSKPHLDVVLSICKECKVYKDQILFRFTIGTADDYFLETWEPNAPSFRERLFALHEAFRSGFKTSVSMEPLLETNERDAIALVELLCEFATDAVWIGKMNKAEERLKRNGYWEGLLGIQWAAKLLINSQTDERILSLYENLKDNPKIKWKESIKEIVGLDLAEKAGLDI